MGEMHGENGQPGTPEPDRMETAGEPGEFEAVGEAGVLEPGVAGPTGEEGVAASADGETGVPESAASPEKLLRAREVVAALLERLGVVADVEVQDGSTAIGCSIRPRSGGDLFATGPRGQVLEAAEYLVNKMVNREAEGRKRVGLELGGFAEAGPDPAIERMAVRLGETARRMGKTLTVVPMQSRDRRYVHQALAGVEGVRTRSEGDGLFRRLLIEPEH